MRFDYTTAKKSGPKFQVLGDRERRLHRILVAKVMHLFGDAEFGIAAFQPEPAVGGPDEPAPRAKLKLTPANTSRPPRLQAKSTALNRIAAIPSSGNDLLFRPGLAGGFAGIGPCAA